MSHKPARYHHTTLRVMELNGQAVGLMGLKLRIGWSYVFGRIQHAANNEKRSFCIYYGIHFVQL